MKRGAALTDIEQRREGRPGLLGSAWRYRFAILAGILAGGLLGYGVSMQLPTTFRADAALVLRDPSDVRFISDVPLYTDRERYVSQQADLVAARPVLEQAAESLRGESAESLEDTVTVEPVEASSQVTVTAVAGTAQAAADKANAVLEAYTDIAREQRLKDVEAGNAVLQKRIAEMREEVEELDERTQLNPRDVVAVDRLRTIEGELIALESRTHELAADAAVFGSGIRLSVPAEVPAAPASPQPVRDAVLVMMLALAVGWALAFWRASRRPRVEARTDPGSVLAVPLLGEIPRFKGAGSGPTGVLPGSDASEAYEFVLSSIEFSLSDLGASSVLVTSAAMGDGKTSTALHIAVASAREARDVILVDTDVRAHGLTSLLRAENHPGIVQLAEHQVTLRECIRRYRLSDTAQLSVVPAGQAPVESTGFTRSPEFKQAVRQITSAAELTIFDSPPLLALADATVLAGQVDAVVLVVDSQTEMEQLLKVKERLAFVPTPLIGYVYNRAPGDGMTAYYTYGRASGARNHRSRRSSPRPSASSAASADSNGHRASIRQR